jgi:hypothetical protein
MISVLFSSFLDLYLYGMYTVFALQPFAEHWANSEKENTSRTTNLQLPTINHVL